MKSKLRDNRNYYKPFNYTWAYDKWLEHEQSHWIFSEVSLSDDVEEWTTLLSKEEKEFLTNVFRFFTQGDIDVAGGYVNNYLTYFPQPEIRMMLLGFASREAVHIAAYSYLIETLGMHDSIYKEFNNYAEMLNKHKYIEDISKDTSTDIDIAKNIAVFSAFMEGMQLFSSFIMLLNFPRNGVLKGMGQIVSWSIQDEMMHVSGMIKLFRTFVKESDLDIVRLEKDIIEIAENMVELENDFIDLSFNNLEMRNLNSKDVKEYIKYIADRRLISLGIKGVFKVKKNPLQWVEAMVNAPIHGNFFETRVTDYSKGSLTGSWNNVWTR